MTILAAFILAMWVWLYRSGLFYSAFGLDRQPLVVGLVVGIVLGDVPTAMVASVPLQLIYMGLQNTGGAIPTDTCIGSIVGISTAVLSGVSPETAVTIAVPVGLVANQLMNLLYVVNGTWVHRAEKAIDKYDLGELSRCATIYPMLTAFIIYVPLMTFLFFKGPDTAQLLLSVIPAAVIRGLGAVGAVLPALGFALIVKTIGSKKLLPFFVGAYFITVMLKGFGNINVALLAIIGAVVGYVYILLRNGNNAEEVSE
ncbi:PTS sugar transporter subunit IIC [Clostridium polynesiense]|uniref:PTS sugar transporter subunit IIC n=1 Tax=Clostridium polynesiense TaxID=1325933 RepID=UPI00058CDAAB|nr:PTS sugar transporter subunit IIC [Clostridium polynesiense]